MHDRLEEIKKSFYVREDDMKWLISEVEWLRAENQKLKEKVDSYGEEYVD